MTSIYDMSYDLVGEILSRVPLPSLGAVRSTCKRWNIISKDPSFKLCVKAAKEIMVIMMYEYKACLMSVNLHNHKDLVDPFMKQIGKLKHGTVRRLFHCSGLLLCVVYESDNLLLVVWNPYTGQTRWIQPRRRIKYYTTGLDLYCMGYDSNNHHKILRCSYCGRLYDIYNFKTNSWKVLDVTIDWSIRSQGVGLKGNSYFIAQERMVREEALEDRLLCFDFTREIFCDLPLPCEYRVADCVMLSVVSEEKLAVLSRNRDTLEIEIWITNTIEPNAVSWNYFLKVDQLPSYKFECIQGSFFVDEKKKIAVICDVDFTANYKACMVGEGGHYREVDLGESICQPLICSSYVPSSVKIE